MAAVACRSVCRQSWRSRSVCHLCVANAAPVASLRNVSLISRDLRPLVSGGANIVDGGSGGFHSGHVPCRHFVFGAGASDSCSGRKRQYSERRILGYSMDQMYAIVAGVERYDSFVPYCTGSVVFARRPGFLKARMSIGFGPIREQYVSSVTLAPPRHVRSECTEGRLFNHLLALWQFSPPPPGATAAASSGQPGCCTLDFSVSFEFRSRLHSRLSNLFFDEVARRMVDAFLQEAHRRYGAPSCLVSPSRPGTAVAGIGPNSS